MSHLVRILGSRPKGGERKRGGILWNFSNSNCKGLFPESVHTEGELGQINESLTVAVRSVECQWLAHVVSLQTSLLHSLLHHLHSLHTGLWVKMAVDAHNIST